MILDIETFNKSKPHSKNKIEVVCDICSKKYITQIRVLKKRNETDCYSCVRKKIYKNMDKTKLLKKVSETCSKRLGHLHPNYNPNRSAFQRYRREVQTLTEKNYKKYKHIINPQNYPRKKMGVLNGYQLDHIISVKEGFERDVSPLLIADINNLQMLPWEENRKKAKGCPKAIKIKE